MEFGPAAGNAARSVWSVPGCTNRQAGGAAGYPAFRDTWHPAPHPPLVKADVFAKAQVLLAERGENHSRRAANGSDYLLAGLIVCGLCGKRFVGTAANGNRYRYKYYTCFSRQRYGADTCPAERLPADELDAAVLDALLAVYDRSDLFEEAVAAARSRATTIHEQHQNELAKVEAELRKTEGAVERYLLAFESGTLPEAQCGERVRRLGATAAELRFRRRGARCSIRREPTRGADRARACRRTTGGPKGHDQRRHTGPQGGPSEPRA